MCLKIFLLEYIVLEHILWCRCVDEVELLFLHVDAESLTHVQPSELINTAAIYLWRTPGSVATVTVCHGSSGLPPVRSGPHGFLLKLGRGLQGQQGGWNTRKITCFIRDRLLFAIVNSWCASMCCVVFATSRCPHNQPQCLPVEFSVNSLHYIFDPGCPTSMVNAFHSSLNIYKDHLLHGDCYGFI